MAIRYFVQHNDSIELPITDGTYYTPPMSMNHDNGWFVIAFYDASGDAITPTAGDIIPLGVPIDGQTHGPCSGDAVIDATSVIASSTGEATYGIPSFTGPMELGQVTFIGIAGADHAKCYFYRG